jgi:hypothetical protein
MAFSEDQSHQMIVLSEARMQSFSMFPSASREVVCDACVNHTKLSIRNDVNPTTAHATKFEQTSVNKPLSRVPLEMAGSSPAMTNDGLAMTNDGLAMTNDGLAMTNDGLAMTNDGMVRACDRNGLLP